MFTVLRGKAFYSDSHNYHRTLALGMLHIIKRETEVPDVVYDFGEFCYNNAERLEAQCSTENHQAHQGDFYAQEKLIKR